MSSAPPHYAVHLYVIKMNITTRRRECLNSVSAGLLLGFYLIYQSNSDGFTLHTDDEAGVLTTL